MSSIAERWKYPPGEEPGVEQASLATVIAVLGLEGEAEERQRDAVELAHERDALKPWQVAVLQDAGWLPR